MQAKPWWTKIFDQNYLNVYADEINAKRTARQISFLLKNLKLKKGAKILDLGCGHGRHSIGFAKQGCKVVGIDISRHFINLAKQEVDRERVNVEFIQQDMRKLSYDNEFDVVISMYSSFGYFNDFDNFQVLKNVAKALKCGGKLVVDINNPTYLIGRLLREGRIDPKTQQLTNSSRKQMSNGSVVSIRLWFNPQTMRWSMQREWFDEGGNHKFKSDVRTYFLPELIHLMSDAGFSFKKSWGDYDSSDYSFDSPRMVVLVEKRC